MAGLGAHVGTSFTLRAEMDGFPSIGGTNVPIWYFSSGGVPRGFMNDRVLPSAHLECIEGRATTLHFDNAATMEHTIHLHGMDVDQRNDGVPQTSYFVPPGGSTTYRFVAPHAGTYHYHCHFDTIVHYARGMYGAVIVRPPDGSTHVAWEGGPTFDEEVLWHLHSIDTVWNNTVLASGAGSARYHPDLFLLNGKVSADAMDDPYTKVVVAKGEKAYLRLLNANYHWARVSLGGLPFQVVASDGRPMRSPVTTGTWELGPGERYDLQLSAAHTADVTAQVDYLDDYTGGVLGSAQTRVQVI